ncbi:type IV pilin [Natrarchaeobaculum aegyptiacum]|uniref:Archaeal Type IV pilin N-terminal domain-containing protein n=1 Tax=Natrarchaeobaculum aegyptiacum TaxID=745377 RepID=A0A2Z2HT21_9EURY|nr:type IV pilin N-terminal domain-containing protein [Natrarchaeobaculum aegyptiacum]ARS90371.1 hypothetical protein B1756_11965 [Natrarchaeobaculum aegyptiacum]
MRLSSSPNGERGVTPVVGVALLLAITVLLAGVVAVYAVDVSDQHLAEPAPMAAFTTETGTCAGTEVTVVHRAGETVPADELSLQSADKALTGSWAKPNGYETHGVGDGEVRSGDRATVCVDDSSTVDLEVVWHADGSDRSAVLYETTA